MNRMWAGESKQYIPLGSQLSLWAAQSSVSPRPGPSYASSPSFTFSPTEPLPEVVVDGVLQGLYGFSTSPAKG